MSAVPQDFVDAIQELLDQQAQRIRNPLSTGPLRIPEPLTAAIHPHVTCSECKGVPGSAECGDDELVRWFVEHGWRAGSRGWQTVVEKFRQTYAVSRRKI